MKYISQIMDFMSYKNGKGVDNLTIEYHLSNDAEKEPDGPVVVNIDEYTTMEIDWIDDFKTIWQYCKGFKYIWSREVVIYSDGSKVPSKARVDNAATVIASWCDESDQTLIDGAHIATGTIDAKRITSDFVSALELEVGNNVKMGADAKISWDNVTDRDSVATTDQVKTEISGSKIRTDQIEVTDLSAFGATIGGWQITESGISKDDFHIYANGNEETGNYRICSGPYKTRYILLDFAKSLSNNSNPVVINADQPVIEAFAEPSDYSEESSIAVKTNVQSLGTTDEGWKVKVSCYLPVARMTTAELITPSLTVEQLTRDESNTIVHRIVYNIDLPEPTITKNSSGYNVVFNDCLTEKVLEEGEQPSNPPTPVNPRIIPDTDHTYTYETISSDLTFKCLFDGKLDVEFIDNQISVTIPDGITDDEIWTTKIHYTTKASDPSLGAFIVDKYGALIARNAIVEGTFVTKTYKPDDGTGLNADEVWSSMTISGNSISGEGTNYINGTWYVDTYHPVSSWRGAKHDIEPLSDKYSILFDNLKPVRFKYNNGNSGRYHLGYILDEMKDAMDIAQIDSSELAAYCIINPETGNGGIRYSEMVALHTMEIQKLKSRVGELEVKNRDLEERLAKIEALLNANNE